MPGSLSTIKGTGYPDYRRRTYGTQAVRVLGGSVDISGTIEHINAVGTLRFVGTVRQVGRVGTVQKVGTVRYIQAGSLGHVTQVGSLAQVGRVGTLQKVGTVRYVEAGSLGHVTQVGTTRYVSQVGTLRRVGTVRYIQAGSLGRVERVGTIGHIPSLGTLQRVGRVGTAHVGTVPTEAFGRRGIYTTLRGNVRLGAGSIWVGSWQHVGSYEVKTLVFKVGNPGTTGGGSVAIITGLQGTGATGGVGTYFGPVRVGKGSYTPLSFTESVRYVRPWIRQHGAGAVAEHGGTVSFHLGLRP